jgi:type VI secretion system secreted protein Hcp
MPGVVIRPNALLKLALALALLALLAAMQWLPAQHALRPLTASAAGGDPIYMQYDTIQGDVTASGYEHQIELTSFQWGVSRSFALAAGNREGSAPKVSEITITKPLDSSSPHLLEEALNGEGKTVVISFVKSSAGQLETYLQITLTNTLISGFSMSSGGDRPTESLSLNFTKIEYKYISLATGPVVVTYDLLTQFVS